MHDRIRMLPISKLAPTPDNRRKRFAKSSLQDLARSIKHDGLLQPIVVRSHPKKSGHWEIRAGQRRWMATKLAGLATIPAIVRDLDDEAALSVTIAENLQRENLHPLEEAETIQQAIDREYDLEAVAAAAGKSVRYVVRRASLTRLVKVWKDAALDPECEVGRFTAAHLELIARLPEVTQTRLAEDDFAEIFRQGFPSVQNLCQIIDGDLRSLQAMPWALDDETLEPKAGSCLNCPKRSGREPLLFDDGEGTETGKVAKHDRCLDPECFERKRVAYVLRCEARHREKHPALVVIQVGYGAHQSDVAEQEFGERAVRVYYPVEAKPNEKGAVPVMPIDGPKAGELIYIRPDGRANGESPRGGRPKDAQGKVIPLTLEERRHRLNCRRYAFIVKAMEEKLQALDANHLSAWAGEAGQDGRQRLNPTHALALALAFGTSDRADRDNAEATWQTAARLRELPGDQLLGHALHDLVRIWVRRLRGVDGKTAVLKAADAKRIGDLLGWDFEEFRAQAKEVIPEPKSWGSLKDDNEPPFTPNQAAAQTTPAIERTSTHVRRTRRPQKQGRRASATMRNRRKRKVA